MTGDDKLEQALAKVRIAGREDASLLTDLMAHVPMEGSLVLSTRRDPDVFSLYDIQRGGYEVFTYDDAFQGMATIVHRDGWLDGVAQRVGYLGDLRIRGTSRERVRFPQLYGVKLTEHMQRTGIRAYYTGILADNALALASLTQTSARAKKRRRSQPHYSLIARYQMANVQLVLPPRARETPGVAVRLATAEDVPRLAGFLHSDHQSRVFGYRFDDGELEHRLARWPGFSLDATFVATSAAGDIIGCTTAWDPAAVKRYRVVRYAGAMRALRLGMKAASVVLGCPPMPRAGEDFKTLYLTNLSVKDDDPRVLRALLDAIYPHAWRARAHMIALPLWDRGGQPDPLAPALDGRIVQRVPFHLYGVTAAEAPRDAWPTQRPGFEMALA